MFHKRYVRLDPHVEFKIESERREIIEYKKITHNPLIFVFVQNKIKRIVGSKEDIKLNN